MVLLLSQQGHCSFNWSQYFNVFFNRRPSKSLNESRFDFPGQSKTSISFFLWNFHLSENYHGRKMVPELWWTILLFNWFKAWMIFFSRTSKVFCSQPAFVCPYHHLLLSLAFKDMRSEANYQKLCCQYQWSVGVSIDIYCYTRHLEERAQSIYLTIIHILFPMISLWN